MLKKILALLLLLNALASNAQNFEWAKKIGGTDNDDSRSMIMDNLGNLYISGYFFGVVDFDPNSGTSTATATVGNSYILKLDSSGNFLWVKTFQTTYTFPMGLAVDSANNVYMTSAFHGTIDVDPGPGVDSYSTSGNGYHIYTVKLDANGNYIWGNTIGNSIGASCQSMGVCIDRNGAVLITGEFFGSMPIDFDPGSGVFNVPPTSPATETFILKLNSSGNFVWIKIINSMAQVTPSAIKSDTSGNIYASGFFTGYVDFDPGPSTYTLNSLGQEDAFILKLDSAGNFIWAGALQGPGYNIITALTLDKTANIYICGLFSGTLDSDPGSAVINTNTTDQAAFVSKLNSSGNLVWFKKLDGSGKTEAMSLTVDTLSNVYAVGSFSGTTDFDPGSGINNLTTNGWFDSYVTKLDASGNSLWAKKISGANNMSGSFAYGVVKGNDKSIFVTGIFVDTVDFDPDAGTVNQLANGIQDIFVLKLGKCNNVLEVNSPATICSGESVGLEASGAYTYSWSPGGATTASITINPSTSTIYTVSGNKSADCAGFASISVSVNACTGLTEREDPGPGLKAFPNPNAGSFIIESSETLNLKLINELGELMNSFQLNEKNNYTVHIPNLPGGIYFIVSEKGSRKILVNK